MLSWIVFYLKKDNVNTQYLIFFSSVILEVIVVSLALFLSKRARRGTSCQRIPPIGPETIAQGVTLGFIPVSPLNWSFISIEIRFQILNYLNAFPLPSVLSPADIWALIIALNLMIVVLFVSYFPPYSTLNIQLFLINFSESANSKYRSLMTNSPSVRKDSQLRYQKKANKELLYDKDTEQVSLKIF